MNNIEDIPFAESAPIEQRDAPTLKEALELYPNDGKEKPTPIKKTTKRGGQVRKLLQQKRLEVDLLATFKTEEDRQRCKERIDQLKAELRQRAKKRKGAAGMRKP